MYISHHPRLHTVLAVAESDGLAVSYLSSSAMKLEHSLAMTRPLIANELNLHDPGSYITHC